jgi:molecular chaperone GrpE
MGEEKKTGKEIEVEYLENESQDTQEISQDHVHNPDGESHKKSKKAKDDKKKKGDEYRQKYEDINEQFLRLRAEFANYKRRVEREQIEFSEYLKGEVIKDFLVVFDDFDHMLKKSEGESNQHSVLKGAKIIYHKFIEVLKNQGIEKIEAMGAEFNPQFHEAMLMQPVDDSDKSGKVIAVFQEGFKLNERLLRASKVVVGEFTEPGDKN